MKAWQTCTECFGRESLVADCEECGGRGLVRNPDLDALDPVVAPHPEDRCTHCYGRLHEPQEVVTDDTHSVNLRWCGVCNRLYVFRLAGMTA